MTHTLHRRLNERDEDYVLFLRSEAGFNRDGAGKILIQLLELMEPLGPVSYGNPVDGSTLRTDPEDIKNNINDKSNLHIVFKDSQSAQKAVEIAQKMDTGLSVTLTGPLGRIRSMAADLDLNINSIQIDLGTIGKMNLDTATEGILSLCGHMRVSESLVEEMKEKVKSGEIDPETASQEIGKVCLCGCFNPHAAAKLLR